MNRAELVRQVAARTGRNPATGASIAVPASCSVSFRAGKGLRARS